MPEWYQTLIQIVLPAVIGITLCIQLLAAGACMRLVQRYGRWWVWGLVAAGMLLLLIRPFVLSTTRLVEGGSAQLFVELMFLLLSILLLSFLWWGVPWLLDRVESSERIEKEYRRVRKEARRQMRRVYDNAPVGMYRTNANGQLLDANPMLARMLALPQALPPMAPGDQAGSLEQGRQLQLPGAMPFAGMTTGRQTERGTEVKLQRPDGSSMWVRNASKPVTDKDGNVLYLEGTLEDITETKQLEQSLAEARSQLSALLETSPVGQFRFDPSGQFLEGNVHVLKALGYRDEEALTRASVADRFKNPDDRTAWKDRLGRDGRVDGLRVEVEHLDGSVRTLELSARAVRGEDDTLLHYQGAMQDVTEEVELRRTLDSLQAELERVRSEEIAEYERKLVGQRKELEQKVEQTESEYARLLEEAEGETRQLRQQLDETVKRLSETHRGELDEAKAELSRQRDQAAAEQRRLEAELEDLRRRQDDELGRLRESHRQAFDELKDVHRQRVEQLQERLEEATRQHRGETEQVKKELDQKLETAASAFEDEKAALVEQHRTQLDRLAEQHKDRCAQLEQSIETVTRQRDQLRAELDRAEAESSERVDTLQQKLDLLEGAMACDGVGLLVTDSSDTVAWANRTAAVLLGLPRDELVGSRPLARLPDATIRHLRSRWQQARDEKTDLDCDAVPLGPSRFVGGHLSPRLDEGNYAGMVCSLVDRTDQVLAEEELRSNEQHLRRIVQNMPTMLVAWDDDGRVIVWNRGAEQVTGYPADEVLTHADPMQLLVHDPHRRSHAVAARREAEDGTWTWEVDCAQGVQRTIRWTDVSSDYPIPGWASWWVGVDLTGSREDTDQLQQTVEALQTRLAEARRQAAGAQARADETSRQLAATDVEHQRLRFIVENLQEGIWQVDAQGQTTWVNRRMAEMLGYTTDEMVGRPLFAFLDRDDIDTVKRCLEQIRTEPGKRHDVVLYGRDGQPVDVSFICTAVTDERGEYAGALAAITDMSDHVAAEQALRQSEARYRQIVENVNDALVVHDFDGTMLDVNENTVELSGLPRDELLGASIAAFATESTNRRMAARMDQLRRQGRLVFDAELLRADGTVVPVGVSARLVSRQGKGVVQSFIRDVSDRQAMIEALRQRDRILEALQVVSDHLLASVTEELVFDEVLEVLGQSVDADHVVLFENSLGEHAEVLTSLGAEWSAPGMERYSERQELVNLSYHAAGLGRWIERMAQGREVGDLLERLPEHERPLLEALGVHAMLAVPLVVGSRWWGMLWFDRRDGAFADAEVELMKTAANTLGVAIQRQEAIDSLSDSEARFRDLLEGLPDVAVQGYTPDGTIVYWNDANETLYGYTAEEVMGENVFDVLLPEDIHDQAREMIAHVVETGEVGPPGEFELLHRDGSRVPVYSSHAMVYRDDGTPELFCMDVDLRPLRRAEDELHAALGEKEVLIKEVHHRVKNNLQLVSSLLDLQEGTLESDPARGALEDSRRRVQTMALIHEHLMQSSDPVRIELAEYLQTLTRHLVEGAAAEGRRPELSVSGEDVVVGMSLAVPVALVVCEWVTNAVKHAFEGIESPRLVLSIGKPTEDQVEVWVRDNGRGLPEDVSVREPRTLGFQLVQLLVGQLGADLVVEQDEGTSFGIRLPVQP